VKLEIEEDTPARTNDLTHKLRPRRGEKLRANLEHARLRAEQRDQPARFRRRLHVERDDEFVGHREAVS
jgi:hypothetical protein